MTPRAPSRPRGAARTARARPAALVAACVLCLGRAVAAIPAAPQETPPRAPEATASPAPRAGRGPGPGEKEIYGRIRGTVLGPAKQALSGLLVQLSARGDNGVLRVTGTDEKGQYLFQDLPAGTYDLEVVADGFSPQKKGAIAVRPPFQNIVDFHLRAAAGPPAPVSGRARPGAAAADAAGAKPAESEAPLSSVRGEFVDQQKRPVAEVSVILVSLLGRGEFQAFSGEDGRFSVPAVPAGRYRVLVESPGHVALDLKSVEVAPGSGLDLRLTLVDHPLDFKGGAKEALPREEPRPAPAASPAPDA
jgi:hypothetical protein